MRDHAFSLNSVASSVSMVETEENSDNTDRTDSAATGRIAGQAIAQAEPRAPLTQYGPAPQGAVAVNLYLTDPNLLAVYLGSLKASYPDRHQADRRRSAPDCDEPDEDDLISESEAVF